MARIGALRDKKEAQNKEENVRWFSGIDADREAVEMEIRAELRMRRRMEKITDIDEYLEIDKLLRHGMIDF